MPSRHLDTATLSAVRALAPGDALVVPLPEGQPARRDAYRTLGGTAHAAWGAGSYRLRGTAKGAMLERLDPVDAELRAWRAGQRHAARVKAARERIEARIALHHARKALRAAEDRCRALAQVAREERTDG